MKCEDVREQIMPFLLGELEQDERRNIEEHLGSCESCGLEADEFRRTIAAMSRWTVPPHERPPVFAILPQAAASAVSSSASGGKVATVIRYSLRVAAVACAALILIVGVRVNVGGGSMVIAIGNSTPHLSGADSAAIAAEVNAMEKRNLKMVSDLISASESRQAELYKSSLNTFSRQISDQQKNYMMYFTNHLYRLQEQNQLAYYQSRAALTGVMKLTDAVR